MPTLRMRLRRATGRLGPGGYLGAVALVSVAVLAAALWASGASAPVLLLFAITGLVTASEAGTALVNLVITRTVRPGLLPALDLATGIPSSLRTLVAVPVLLHDAEDLQAQIDQLEVHHLSSTGGALHYALLSDGPDAASQTTPQDALSDRHGRGGDDAPECALPVRRRRPVPVPAPPSALESFGRRLDGMGAQARQADRTEPPAARRHRHEFPAPFGACRRMCASSSRSMPTRACCATRCARLIGKMAHPLNRAVFDPAARRVTAGYGILQPRVTPALPIGHEGSSVPAGLSPAPAGSSPMPAATSDVYQDLFGEGSFTGKGIYDVDAFAASLAGRVPENTMLSHDLFEGDFARAGLASDIEVVEDFPGTLRCRRPPPAPLGAGRLAAFALDHPARTAGRSAAGSLEDDRQSAARPWWRR